MENMFNMELVGELAPRLKRNTDNGMKVRPEKFAPKNIMKNLFGPGVCRVCICSKESTHGKYVFVCGLQICRTMSLSPHSLAEFFSSPSESAP